MGLKFPFAHDGFKPAPPPSASPTSVDLAERDALALACADAAAATVAAAEAAASSRLSGGCCHVHLFSAHDFFNTCKVHVMLSFTFTVRGVRFRGLGVRG